MKNISSLVLVVLFLTCSIGVSAQDKAMIDSLLQLVDTQKDTTLIKTYRQLFIAYLPRTPKKAKPYLDKALEELAKIKDAQFTAQLTKDQGAYYYQIADYRKANTFYKEAITLAEAVGDKRLLSSIYNNLGIVLKYLGQPKEALESHLTALRLKEELNRTGATLAASYMNIGVLHSDLGNLDASNDYYKKAEAILEEEKMKWRLTMIRSNIAINMEKAGKIDEALDYYLQSIPYFQEKEYHLEEAKQYNLIGALYLDREELSQAKDYFSKALKLSKEKGEAQIAGLATRNIGDVYFKQKRYAAALQNFNEALEISTENATETRMITSYLRLAKTHAALGNYKQAYYFRKQHFDKYDEVFKKENIEKLNELEIQYQTEKKEQQIELQDKEILLLENEAKVSNLQRILMGLGLLLSLIGFYALNQKIKRNKLEKEKVDADLALQSKELEFKKKELTTHAFNLARKNETLENLKKKAETLKKSDSAANGYQQLIRAINFDLKDDDSWESFSRYFEDVHKGFNSTAVKRYPDLTPNELRLMSLLKMNLSSKEIANILNISIAGIKKARQRLRKKMGLATSDSLENAVLTI